MYKINTMICPNCKKEMIGVERNDVELDYCMFCSGFWFDAGEWNILSKKLIAEDLTDRNIDLFELPKVQTGERLRRCPVCGSKMEKFEFNGILLDRCSCRHGVWFDKNEFSSCINSLTAQSETKEQINFLGEVFNKV